MSKPRTRSLSFALAFATAVAGPARAQAPAPASATLGKPPVAKAATKVTSVEGITEYRLDNGLQVLFFPDQSKATVTVNLTVFVGSRHEGLGESGMAHLLEHMLFKGTPTHPDVWKLLQEHGAQFNGTTWFDRTNYYETMPATPENLEFGIKLEADRLVNSTIAGDALAKEFSVVRNEFEMGENNPAGVLEDKMLSVAYQWHNYGKTVIGSRSDIERVPVENLRGFYRKHYQPDNAMLVVAGKYDEKRAMELVMSSFGKLPRPARKLEKTWTVEPVQDGERTITLRRTGDVAVVAVLYHASAGADPDWVAADAITDILTAKPSGRLYKALVEKGLASELFGYVYPTADPGIIYVGAKVRAGGSPDKVRDILIKTVEAVANAKIDASELERWRTRSLKEYELQLTDTGRVGVALSDWAAMGDWRLFFLTRDRCKTVQIDDLARVAKKFLKESNRTVGTFIPTKSPDRAPLTETPDVVAVMKDFKGGAAAAEGETFVATTETLDARTTRSTLPGGIKLALLPKKTKGGAVRVALVLRFGGEKALRGRIPAAGLLPQLLLRGSKKHSFQQLKDEFDRLKADVSFGGGRSPGGNPGVVTVRIKTVHDNLAAVLSLVAEVLREPAFPAPEFETMRKEMLSKLEEQLQDPTANAMSTIFQKVYPWPKDDVRHVASIKESIDDLKSLKLADAAKLHKDLWGASHAQIAVVGDFDPVVVKAQIDKDLGSWKSPKPYERIARVYKETAPSAEDLNTPDKENAFVGVGHAVALKDDDPDYPAAVMVNFVLGGSAGSRLLNRLRQKDGLSYGAFSGLSGHPLDKSGMFYAGAICAPQNADKAMAALLHEIDKLRGSGVTDKELADAKKAYAQTWNARVVEEEFQTMELTQGLYLGRTFDYYKKLNEKIDKLTVADVNAAARKFIQPDKLAKVRAGDLAKAKAKS